MAPRRNPLTMEDREDISRGLAKGLSNKDIAASTGRDESVICREIERHGGAGRVPCLEGGRGGPRVTQAPEGAQNRHRAGTARAGHRRSEERLVTGADSGQIVLSALRQSFLIPAPPCLQPGKLLCRPSRQT